MTNLNEDCLRHILHYLQPHDWIHTYQVCSLWRAATLSQFQKITEIIGIPYRQGVEKYERIRSIEAKKIIYIAAPFIKVLDLSESGILGDCFYFGGFFYYVVDKEVDEDTILKLLLAESDTELTEVRFRNLPKKELSKILFSRNKITKVAFCDSGDIYPEIPTDGIEELKIYFYDVHQVSSFKDLFPDLKRLKLNLKHYSRTASDCKNGSEAVLLQILPYVLGIKSFHLYIDFEYDPKQCEDFFQPLLIIAKFSQLEELSINHPSFYRTPMDKPWEERFFKQLATGCPKLQIVHFRGIAMKERNLHETLLLPNLKCLDVDSVISFGLTELPWDMRNLSEFRMGIKHPPYLNFTNLSCFLKHLPGLKIIEIHGLCRLPKFIHIGRNQVETCRNEKLVELVCGVVVVGTSQGKYIVVIDGCHQGYPPKQLKIARDDFDFVESQKLFFIIGPFFYRYRSFIESAKTFLRNKGQINYVFTMEDLNK